MLPKGESTFGRRQPWTSNSGSGSVNAITPQAGCGLWKDRLVRVYALTGSQSLHETLDLFLTREAADAELREILEDEPEWKDVLRVVPIELDEQRLSNN
jgi:hypothetical protein